MIAPLLEGQGMHSKTITFRNAFTSARWRHSRRNMSTTFWLMSTIGEQHGSPILSHWFFVKLPMKEWSGMFPWPVATVHRLRSRPRHGMWHTGSAKVHKYVIWCNFMTTSSSNIRSSYFVESVANQKQLHFKMHRVRLLWPYCLHSFRSVGCKIWNIVRGP